MDDAIKAIETSTELFENGGTEINQLVEIVQVFQGLPSKDNSRHFLHMQINQ